MAKRLLRPWLKSERMHLLSAEAERFFTRLIMVADDHGRYDGNPKLLKAALFPLTDFSDVNVAEWLDECVTVGVVGKYSVGGKAYIVIDNFDQRLQTKRSLFPAPPADLFNPPNVTVDHGESPPELEERRKKKEVEPEVEPADAEVWPAFADWWSLYGKSVNKSKCEKKWQKIPHLAREQIMAHTGEYVKATPDKKFRKDPTTYLNNESWNDEIIGRTNGKSTTHHHPAAASVADFAKRVSEKSSREQIRPDPSPG